MTEYIGTFTVYKSVEADNASDAVEQLREWASSNLTGIDCDYKLEGIII